MSVDKLNEVRSIIAGLDMEEVRQVQLFTNLILGGKTSFTNKARYLLDALQKVYMKRRGSKFNIPYKDNKTITAFEQAVDYFFTYTMSIFPSLVKRPNTKIILYNMLSEIIINHLDNRQIPVTLKTVTFSIYKLPDLLEHAFPNYLSQGLLEKLIIAKVKA